VLLDNYLGLASLFSAFVASMVAVYSTRKDRVPSQFSIFVFFLILWSLAMAFSFFSNNIALHQFWFALETASTAFFVYFWMSFISEYALDMSLRARRIRDWLLVFPIFFSLALLTNSYHGLFWQSSSKASGILSEIMLNAGPFYNYLYLPYSFGAASFSIVILIYRFFRSSRQFKRQLGLLIVANLMPVLSLVTFLSSPRDAEHYVVDYTPYSVLVSSLIVAFILFKEKSFRHLPIMAKNLFKSIENAVFMLDANALIVDYNRGAAEFVDNMELGFTAIKDRSIFEIIPKLINNDDLFSEQEVNIYDTSVFDKFYDINIIPVRKNERIIVGYAIIIKDVSSRHMDLQRINRLSEFRKKSLELHSNLVNSENFNELYQYILEQAIAIIPEAEAGSVLIRQDDNKYRFEAVVGYSQEELSKIEFDYDELLYVRQKANNSFIARDLHEFNRAKLSGNKQKILIEQTSKVRVTLAIPVYVKERLLAIFHLDNMTNQYAFDHEAEQMAEIFSNHIAETINRSVLKREIDDLARYSNAMLELNGKLLNQEGYKNYYELLGARAESVLKLAIATIPNAEYGSFLLKADDGNYYFKAAVGFDMEALRDTYLKYDELTCSGSKQVVFKKSNVGSYSSEILEEERLQGLIKAGKLSEIKSSIALPIYINDNLVAVFNLDNTKVENAFDSRATVLAEAFANHIADLIYKVNLQKEIDSLDIFRKSMLELSTKLLGQDSEAEFYQLLLTKAIESVPKTEFASVLELKDDGMYRIIANYGYDIKLLKETEFALSDMPRELSDKGKSSVLVNDIKDFIKHDESVKALFIAIRLENEIKAILILASTQQQYMLQKQSRQFAEVFASHVAAMLKRHQVENALQQGKLHDSLTGLANRTPLLDRLQHILGMSWRNNSDFAVLFLEIDRFENISSSYGHNTADLLIKYIAKRLEHSLRPGDTVSRWGNYQFVILLEQLDSKDQALEIINKLRKTISKSFLIDDIEIMVTMTVGAVFDNKRYELAEEILQNAEISINRAKAMGMGYMVFHDDMSKTVLEKLSLENDIRKALEHDCFHMVYQPIVDIESDEIVGFEALLRWNRKNKGPISPAKFIPIAEELGLIIEIDKWVIQNAIKQIAVWDASHKYKKDFTISINISGASFLEDQFFEYISKNMEKHNVAKSRLRLELTEHTIMEDIDSVTDILAQFRAKGIQVLIDDFGTGYSSLNYLHKLPLDILKIDMSFIQGLPNDYSQVMVKTIVSLAHNLKLKVVAEGVETIEQLKYLQKLGCEYAQGYYYNKPMTLLELEQTFFNKVTALPVQT